jgi:hypothetical protein
VGKKIHEAVDEWRAMLTVSSGFFLGRTKTQHSQQPMTEKLNQHELVAVLCHLGATLTSPFVDIPEQKNKNDNENHFQGRNIFATVIHWILQTFLC